MKTSKPCPRCFGNRILNKVEAFSGSKKIYVLFYWWCKACEHRFCTLNILEKE